MSIRSRVLVLMASLMVFLSMAAAVAFLVRARVGESLERVAERDVRLLALATDVTAAHLEQAIRLERMLRHSIDRTQSASADAAYAEARDEYEELAAGIWHRLQEARRVTEESAAADDPQAPDLLGRVERIDAAHNAYAESFRNTLALLEQGHRREALAATGELNAGEERLQHALGSLLREAATSAELAASDARRDDRLASIVVGSLLASGLLVAAWISATVVHLVSEMRTLSGLLPICSQCKKIRDDSGYWNQLEAYVEAHSHAAFTHGLCGDCQTSIFEQIAAGREPAEASVS